MTKKKLILALFLVVITGASIFYIKNLKRHMNHVDSCVLLLCSQSDYYLCNVLFGLERGNLDLTV